jgi:hypothetical protein
MLSTAEPCGCTINEFCSEHERGVREKLGLAARGRAVHRLNRNQFINEELIDKNGIPVPVSFPSVEAIEKVRTKWKSRI